MWNLIEATHTVAPTSNAGGRLQIARDNLATFTHTSGLPLSQHIQQHKKLVTALRNCRDTVDEEREAEIFTSRLDRGVFKSYILDFLRKKDPWPKTLTDAYNQAEAFYGSIQALDLMSGATRAKEGKAFVVGTTQGQKESKYCTVCKNNSHCTGECRRLAKFLQEKPDAIRIFFASEAGTTDQNNGEKPLERNRQSLLSFHRQEDD